MSDDTNNENTPVYRAPPSKLTTPHAVEIKSSGKFDGGAVVTGGQNTRIELEPVTFPSDIPDEAIDATLKKPMAYEPPEDLKSSLEFPSSYRASTAEIPEGFVRFNPISNGVFYDTDDIFVRKLKGSDIINIVASAESKSFTDFIDAIAPTVKGIDVRQLTYGDWQGLLYWQLFNSFTRAPFERKYVTIYGNEITVQITRADIKYKELKMSKTEWLEIWKPKGLKPLLVADAEYLEDLSTMNTPMTQVWRANRSVLFVGDGKTIESKYAAYDNAEIDVLESLSTFNDLQEHGVHETLKVTDPKFDPEKWLELCRINKKVLQAAIGDVLSSAAVIRLHAEIEDMDEEIERVSTLLEKGVAVVPETEDMPVKIAAADFFSAL